MILLIQELQEKYDLLDENLNSIMILLIHHIADCIIMRYDQFKFHYDSINSEISVVLYHLYMDLNSIMILLIRKYTKNL